MGHQLTVIEQREGGKGRGSVLGLLHGLDVDNLENGVRSFAIRSSTGTYFAVNGHWLV